VALVLGSGLGDFVESIPSRQGCPYAQIPHFPVSNVVGHAGVMTIAETDRARFGALQGRVHFYEGVPQCSIVFPVRALAVWGVRDFLITNAAGAVNQEFTPGELMLITDHINLLGDNPLAGPNIDPLGERFPDMTRAYDLELRTALLSSASKVDLILREGVYAAVKGPSYETPAEIRMLRAIGADAVGMSTVPEVIALNHLGRRVAGLSCITNMAAGILDSKLVHAEVLEITHKVKESFGQLMMQFLEFRSG
jgi:purine-nucleoside phosphorylase